MTHIKIAEIITQHVPANAAEYCIRLWEQSPFLLKLTKGRQTKVGDFTCKHGSTTPRITLNHDLNQYTFLITYIHEVAHWHVYKQHGNKLEPHGTMWKNIFRELMLPLLNETVFPTHVLLVLVEHMTNPKASSFADTKLTQALRQYDRNYLHQIPLADLPEGSIFNLHGRYCKKGTTKRTRVLCRELKSKRQYLVPADALVSNVQLSIL
jgi:SprT protein